MRQLKITKSSINRERQDDRIGCGGWGCGSDPYASIKIVIFISNIDQDMADKLDLQCPAGVYVRHVAAMKGLEGGIRNGDVRKVAKAVWLRPITMERDIAEFERMANEDAAA